ncbi:hypothetical protein [Pseudochryseolinea flava]|uniref:Uncharacterized protein n=1 Tax=Pseudochryseolinea flava TaxID=2059302 RepID=A0A364Y773_9BACT|nr:hypothetical protein [Pseudochryseolinea flava]RAW02790.1 hypothetical protein DQQ10_01395 [Pseudochryseolinea flava]
MGRKPHLRIFALIIGLITVGAIVFSQLFYFQNSAQAKVKKETKTEQQEENEHDDVFISLPSPSLPSSSHVILQLESFCLFETSSNDEEISDNDTDIRVPVTQFFQTLVGAIISPNAP